MTEPEDTNAPTAGAPTRDERTGGEPTAGAPTRDEPTGGDPVCWLERVCPDCGAFVSGELPTVCWRCDTVVSAT